jgi:1,4-alpha-glucan branching enzyme
MQGHFVLMLHAHLPFVRHPEHEKFLEEDWLFEAITETYIPLIQNMESWQRDGMDFRLTMSISPPLCAMLLDPLLQERYLRRLNSLIELAENEIHRTHWDPAYRELAWMYHHRFTTIRETYFDYGRNLVGAFRRFQDDGKLEIATCAATHALLPFLVDDPSSLRAQILVARDHYRECFGREPRGIWLPECAYVPGIEPALQEANIRWFVTETHGILHSQPRARYGVFAPIFTPNGLAVFGRDFDSARQVWSKDTGYPGDARYRDFYRDVGFDLDFDYVKPYLPSPNLRGFTGVKYHAISGDAPEKRAYDRAAALRAADEHAGHFLQARLAQMAKLEGIMDRPPVVFAPYDAELFGHWWYEGPEFLNLFMRKAYYDQKAFTLVTPHEFLKRYPTQQVATPGASSWGEEGYWRVWLNESNQWIYPHLRVAQGRMTELAAQASPTPLQERALKQAARELLLAQASDWPFILRTGTSPGYASQRVKDHLLRFTALYDQLAKNSLDEVWLAEMERADNLFPNLDWRYWRAKP